MAYLTASGRIVGWGGLESLTGPTVRHRVPDVEPFAEYGTEASIGNERTKIIMNVDTAWRSACVDYPADEIEDIERRLVAEAVPELLAKYQEQRELFSGEVRFFTLSAPEMIRQYEELKPQITTYLLSKKS
jgi:hypothetical protein